MLILANCGLIVISLTVLCSLMRTAEAHGRMLEPPARNTLWRFGFKAPANYNDNELFCGGIGVSTTQLNSSTNS